MTVALVSGFWGQNIGNAFFNLGGKACLEAAGAQVAFIQDQPAYWTFRNEAKGNYSNAWPILEKLDVDLVVLQGPLFTRNFGNIWRETLTELRASGVDWAILSGAFRSYTDEELAVAGDLIRSHPPRFVSTRDVETAERLEPYFPDVRSGIDSAFFSSFAFMPPSLRTDPFMALNFDHFPEPELVEDPQGPLHLPDGRYSMSFPDRGVRLAQRSKAHAYVAHLLDRRPSAHRIGGLEVVRPEHRSNPHLPFKIYRSANALASDEPWTYLTLYANAALTLADRVHACVATLAYGGEAMLYNPTTKRKALFDAVGASGIDEKPQRLERELIVGHHRDLVGFLEARVA